MTKQEVIDRQGKPGDNVRPQNTSPLKLNGRRLEREVTLFTDGKPVARERKWRGKDGYKVFTTEYVVDGAWVWSGSAAAKRGVSQETREMLIAWCRRTGRRGNGAGQGKEV